ncbi:MAG: heme exporter protein CcmD [Burkholderiaceae bacterium]
MIWSDWSQFLAMGGYGPYVWGSLGMCVLVALAEIFQLSLRNRAVRVQAEKTGGGANQ